MNIKDATFNEICSLNKKELLAKLKNDRFIVNITNELHRTILMEAVINNNEDLSGILIKHGADVNRHDISKWTALHFAAQEYNVNIAKLLITAGAEVDAEDMGGNTPLFRSLFNSKGRGDVICFLLQSGASRDHKNIHGVSPEGLASKITNYNLNKYFQ